MQYFVDGGETAAPQEARLGEVVAEVGSQSSPAAIRQWRPESTATQRRSIVRVSVLGKKREAESERGERREVGEQGEGATGALSMPERARGRREDARGATASMARVGGTGEGDDPGNFAGSPLAIFLLFYSSPFPFPFSVL